MDELTKQKIHQIEDKYAEIMEILGIDLNSPHSKDTPRRVAKMLVTESFRALSQPPPKVKTFPVEQSIFPLPVVVKDIKFYSSCAHHHVTFYGTADIAYQPLDRVAGLSKFHRVVEYFAAKPQIQEALTEEISDYLFASILPRWIAVRVKAVHLCVCARGVKNEGHTETYAIRSTGHSGMSDKEILDRFLELLR